MHRPGQATLPLNGLSALNQRLDGGGSGPILPWPTAAAPDVAQRAEPGRFGAEPGLDERHRRPTHPARAKVADSPGPRSTAARSSAMGSPRRVPPPRRPCWATRSSVARARPAMQLVPRVSAIYRVSSRSEPAAAGGSAAGLRVCPSRRIEVLPSASAVPRLTKKPPPPRPQLARRPPQGGLGPTWPRTWPRCASAHPQPVGRRRARQALSRCCRTSRRRPRRSPR